MQGDYSDSDVCRVCGVVGRQIPARSYLSSIKTVAILGKEIYNTLMVEAFDEKSRILSNPLRLLRCGVELGRFGVGELFNRIDKSLDIKFDPELLTWDMVEAPVETEAELDGPPYNEGVA